MRKIILVFLLSFLVANSTIKAWNSQGHKLVAKIAKSQLDKNVIEWVDYYLKGMSWELAACWMDMVKSDARYGSMKAWHYVYTDKDKTYVKTKEPNIINQLNFTINMLRNRNLLEMEKVNELLRVLFHLIGDIHQPLNCGYGSDKGGQDVPVKFLEKNSNLFKVWETEILDEKKIDLWTCSKVLLNLSTKERINIEKIDVTAWANDTRLLLPEIYNFKNGKIDNMYIDLNNPVVCKQIVKGGLRLASVLNKIFKS